MTISALASPGAERSRPPPRFRKSEWTRHSLIERLNPGRLETGNSTGGKGSAARL